MAPVVVHDRKPPRTASGDEISIQRNLTHRQGFPGLGRLHRRQEQAPGLGPDLLRSPGGSGGRLHPEPGGGRTRQAGAEEHPGRAGAGLRHQRRQRQRLHRRAGPTGGRGHDRRGGRSSGSGPVSGDHLLDGDHRADLSHGKGGAGHPRLGAEAVEHAVGGSPGGQRHPDDGHLSQGELQHLPFRRAALSHGGALPRGRA